MRKVVFDIETRNFFHDVGSSDPAALDIAIVGIYDSLTDSYKSFLQEELKEVSEKRATAKKLLEADKDYQVVNSELEELKFKYKDLMEIMSHHLVTYFTESGETQLTTSNGEVLQVVVSAKLGKEVAE